jgi:DNA primase
MALSQSFNVKLALLPDGQDPDSYIQQVGASQFDTYIKEHKRDIIGFRMEVGMKETDNDPVKKSKLVNEIAESISRINKAEDFALQDYYIKQASELLKVEEQGMVNLVNKFIRDRIESERRTAPKISPEEENSIITTQQQIADANQSAQDESQEWQLIKVLLTHGHKSVEGRENAAQLIYDRIDPEMIDSKDVLQFFKTYYDYVSEHQSIPDTHYFTNHPNEKIQIKTATLLQNKNEVSHNWLEIYGIGTLNGDDNYLQDIESSIGYFELKKLKVMQAQLRDELNTAKDNLKITELMQQFIALKKTEQEILQRPGTVIVK